MDGLLKAIEIIGNQTALAAAVGVVPMAVTQWKRRGVPPERCLAIQEATNGRVTVNDLRPDVFGPPAAEKNEVAA